MCEKSGKSTAVYRNYRADNCHGEQFPDGLNAWVEWGLEPDEITGEQRHRIAAAGARGERFTDRE